MGPEGSNETEAGLESGDERREGNDKLGERVCIRQVARQELLDTLVAGGISVFVSVGVLGAEEALTCVAGEGVVSSATGPQADSPLTGQERVQLLASLLEVVAQSGSLLDEGVVLRVDRVVEQEVAGEEVTDGVDERVDAVAVESVVVNGVERGVD